MTDRKKASDVSDEDFDWYEKKPVEVEAVQMDEPFVVETMENKRGEKLYGDAGDWLIRGVKGELYPCEDEVFQETYKDAEVEDNPLIKANESDEYEEGELSEAVFFLAQSLKLVELTVNNIDDASSLNDLDKEAVEELENMLEHFDTSPEDGVDASDFRIDEELE